MLILIQSCIWCKKKSKRTSSLSLFKFVSNTLRAVYCLPIHAFCTSFTPFNVCCCFSSSSVHTQIHFGHIMLSHTNKIYINTALRSIYCLMKCSNCTMYIENWEMWGKNQQHSPFHSTAKAFTYIRHIKNTHATHSRWSFPAKHPKHLEKRRFLQCTSDESSAINTMCNST